jgi:hypothetical protein
LANTGANLAGQGAGASNQAAGNLGELAAALRGQDLDASTSTTNTATDNLLRSLFAQTDTIKAQNYPELTLNALGGDLQQQKQAELTDQRQKEDYNQNRRYLAALEIAQTALGLPNAGTTTTGGSSGPGLGAGIGTGIGAAAGLYFGGPFGAALGGSLGGGLGGVVDKIF